MSYSLELFLEPGVQRDRILQYFAGRRNFSTADERMDYENPDTGVYFSFALRCARDVLFRTNVVSTEFEINYNRPSFFGIEAERELTAFVAAFEPRIEDAQIEGMGEGPYSGEGFLRGWNFGNVFSVRAGLSRWSDRAIDTMPADQLRTVWSWNYQCAERRKRLGHRRFVPTIMFFRIEGRASRVVVWGEGTPILLPIVDHVLVGRHVSGEKRVGLAPWSEVQDVVKRAGFDTADDPLDLEYFVTPPPIANWVANTPLIDLKALERLSSSQIIDDELVAAARESIEHAKPSSDQI